MLRVKHLNIKLLCLFDLYLVENSEDRLSHYTLYNFWHECLKGTATLMIIMFNMKELSEPWILIPVSFKSVEKYGSHGRLNICK